MASLLVIESAPPLQLHVALANLVALRVRTFGLICTGTVEHGVQLPSPCHLEEYTQRILKSSTNPIVHMLNFLRLRMVPEI